MQNKICLCKYLLKAKIFFGKTQWKPGLTLRPERKMYNGTEIRKKDFSEDINLWQYHVLSSFWDSLQVLRTFVALSSPLAHKLDKFLGHTFQKRKRTNDRKNLFRLLFTILTLHVNVLSRVVKMTIIYGSRGMLLLNSELPVYASLTENKVENFTIWLEHVILSNSWMLGESVLHQNKVINKRGKRKGCDEGYVTPSRWNFSFKIAFFEFLKR